MRFRFFLFLVFGVCHIKDLKAFECGFKNQPSQKLRSVLSQCLSGDQSIEKFLEMATSTDDQDKDANQSDGSSTDDEDESEENEQPNQMSKGSSATSNKDSRQSNNNSNNQQHSNSNNWNSKFGKMASYRKKRSPNDYQPRLMRGPLMPHLLIAPSRSKRATTSGSDDKIMRRPLMPHMLLANSRSRRDVSNGTNVKLMRPLMPHRMLAINRDQLIKITGKAYPSIASTTDRSNSFVNTAAPQENDDSSANDEENETNDQDDKNNNVMCAVHCVFEKMDLTDSNGLPGHSKFLDNLLEAANSRDLRNFMQKSTDECFQQMEEEDSQDTCKYSTKLVSCLAEKGRQDCSDWPSLNPIPL